MSKSTPRTNEYFEEKLIPYFVKTVALLIDDASILGWRNGKARPDVFRFEIGTTFDVHLYLRLPPQDAGRIIGKFHTTRQALYQVFQAICKNHGFHLARLEVYGDDSL